MPISPEDYARIAENLAEDAGVGSDEFMEPRDYELDGTSIIITEYGPSVWNDRWQIRKEVTGRYRFTLMLTALPPATEANPYTKED